MPENRSILYVCEDLEGERNAKIALLDDFTPQKSPLQILERAFGDIFHAP